MAYLSILFKVMPVLVLLLLGYMIKLKGFLSTEAVTEIKRLVVNISLPALLFLVFLDVDFRVGYFLVILVIFLANILMLFLGRGFAGLFAVENPYFPLLFTGFEVGMLGIPLFGAVYGLENVKYMGVVQIGQELYVWFILLGLIFSLRKEGSNYRQVLQSFISSPVIIAIILGIVVNLTGLNTLAGDSNLYKALMNSLDLIAGLTVPLILIIIGYEINFKTGNLRLPLKIIGLRLILFLVLALFINKYIFTNFLNLNKMYNIALMSMFILPPPFIIPLFIADDEENKYIFNTLSLATLVSLAVYIGLTVFYGVRV